MQTTKKYVWSTTAQDSTQDSSNIYTIAKKSCIICNSCRYCEGLCAVFPAMERFREFSDKDVDYLANLCHQCSECFYDCQYAPPHEFNVSIPTQFAQIRQESYKNHAFPSFLGKVFDKNAVFSTSVLVIVLFLGFVLSSMVGDSASLASAQLAQDGNFYTIIPYNYMVSVFSVAGILVALAILISCMRYAKTIKLPKISFSVFIQTLKDVATLRYLGGHNSEGCTYPNIERSNVRRFFHHFTAYGFVFCFISTTLAAIYSHFLGLQAPYPLFSLPKTFGLVGGILLCIGLIGLFILKLKADKEIKDSVSIGMDYVLLCMLFIVSASGLVLMCFKTSSLLSPLLWFHLSCVLAFFVIIPYSKFVHIFYRFLALLKYNAEEKL